jgi:transposase-like protein/IS1 family transposase
MLCPTCQNEGRKFGKDRRGNQRFQCLECRKTFSDRAVNPLKDMRLSLDKAIHCLTLLTEGMSIRATVRTTGVAKATVLSLLVSAGHKAEAFLREAVSGVEAHDVQADEVWGFIRMKDKTAKKKRYVAADIGDAYCFIAIERHTKLILAWHLSKRDGPSAKEFMENVRDGTRGHFQLSTDGFPAYPEAVSMTFEKAGRAIDHAAVVKTYGKMEDDHKYSPSAVIGMEVHCCGGNPDLSRACTSHIERQNLQVRMQNRRMTRLTNAFSKKWDNHRYAMALHFATYNFVRPHGTLTKEAEGHKTTPAMKAGLADHPWSMNELLEKIAGYEVNAPINPD